jgi:hypothetical protein
VIQTFLCIFKAS